MAKTHNTTTAPTAQIAPFGLRMLPDLRAQVEAAAKASGRSMNAEIVSRLEASFAITAFPATDKTDLDAMVDISMAQLDFNMVQNHVAEARDEFSRARMRYDALVIQEAASGYAPQLKEHRLQAMADAERAQLTLKRAESDLFAAQKKLADSHVVRLQRRKP